MRFWLAHSRPNLKPKRLSEAIPAYLKYLEAMEREPAYRKHIEAHLRVFSEAMGDQPVHEITHQVDIRPVVIEPDIPGCWFWERDQRLMVCMPKFQNPSSPIFSRLAAARTLGRSRMMTEPASMQAVRTPAAFIASRVFSPKHGTSKR